MINTALDPTASKHVVTDVVCPKLAGAQSTTQIQHPSSYGHTASECDFVNLVWMFGCRVQGTSVRRYTAAGKHILTNCRTTKVIKVLICLKA